ncbi:hypothetical protein [Pseudoalteromonas sp. MMG022]|nr:hypothetical protein [Pseudoalteromonas sp. MMG022]MCF6434083.1 hypothetical protein [Pseudoalteromonas sp. MMG022]
MFIKKARSLGFSLSDI